MKKIVFLLAAVLILAGCAAIKTNEEKTYTQIDQDTAKKMMANDDGHVVVDVRRQDEYDAGHIPGAILIPNESIGCDSPEVLPDYEQVILIYCRSGNRSKQAAEKLASMGFSNVYEFGGINTWTGEIVTTEEENVTMGKQTSVNNTPVDNTTVSNDSKDSPTLRFSSFSGGGYEYTAVIDDPSIVNCESRYEYEEHAEEIDGASFDYIVSFTGLKPGSTMVTIYGRSPIAENENSIYTVFVDDALQVTLSPVRDICCFYVYRNGEINYDSYKITMEEDGYYLSVNEETAQVISKEDVAALMDVIDYYDVVSWNGFSESKKYVLDGEGFWLDFTLTDGTKVHARGNNAFPEQYFAAIGEMWDVLMRMTEQ